MALPDAADFRRETSPDAVARYLRALIVGGTLRPGARVPRDDVAAQLGVSPVPVREAIIALAAEGWLRIEPHRGAFVHGVDDAWITDHYGLMGAVYGLLAARACDHATDAERAELTDLGRALRTADPDGFTALNDRAMRRLIAAARSPRLEAAARAVPNVVPGDFFSEVPGTLEPQRRAMTRTIRAIAAGDDETAAATMRRLAATQAAAVVSLLHRRGVLAPSPA